MVFVCQEKQFPAGIPGVYGTGVYNIAVIESDVCWESLCFIPTLQLLVCSWNVVDEIKQFVHFTWNKHSSALQEWLFINNNKIVSQNSMALFLIIIWQALRAGSMQRILCFDWLPEQARWSDTAHPGLPVSFPQIKFCQSSSRCTKIFFCPNYFLLR